MTSLITDLAHTYSIVARDPSTGAMGVAVQSHYFSVGPICPWAKAGVGAVATQSFVDPSYGPLGLQMMKAGKKAGDALAGLVAADAAQDRRQVAMVDNEGNVAVHTGSRCIAEAGHRTGDGYSVQANMMLKDTVWDAMGDAFESFKGDLASRMLAALDAAEAEGGDIRGRQSAAILIVSGTNTGKPWADREMELRVEDHPQPLAELRRLVDIHRAYKLAAEAESKMQSPEQAPVVAAEFAHALELSGDNIELRFWYALTLALAGNVDEAVPLLTKIYEEDDRWRELLSRLPAAGIISDEGLAARLTAI